MKKVLIYSAIAIVTLGLAFIFTDCCAGRQIYRDCHVVDKEFKEGWTEFSRTTDSDGHTTTKSEYHPPEYYLHCQDVESSAVLRVSVNSGMYHSTGSGDAVVVHSRQGKWTGADYLATVTKAR